MPRSKDNERTVEVKRLQADVKGGQGTFFLAVIISAVYTGKVLLFGDFNFFFSLFLPEVLLKSARFTAAYPPTFGVPYGAFFEGHLLGSLPNAAVWVALAVIYGGCILLAILARKRHMLVIGELVIYATDTLLVCLCHLFSFPETASLNALIDPIFHVFVLILIVRSVIATVKLKKRGFSEADFDFYA